MLLLTVHAVAVCALAGLAWTVQVVVYPGFRFVGGTSAWAGFHAAHAQRITRVVAGPWAVQGATLAVLLLHRPAGVPLPLVLAAAALGLVTVAVTVLVSVPLHGRLATYDDTVARQLVATNWWRTAAWTAGAGCAAAMLVAAA